MTGTSMYQPGMSVGFSFTVSQQDQDDFARLSGDHNPMHLQADYARALGFAGPVVYGGLLVAKISRVIGMEWPGVRGIWGDLNIRFRKPLLVGQEATLTAVIEQVSPASGSLTIKIDIVAGSVRIATATVLAVLLRQSGP